MPSRLHIDSAVEPTGSGAYRVNMDRGWWIERGPNGGYIGAILGRAIDAEVADHDRMIRSFTVHYLRPPEAGVAEVVVAIRRVGRTLTTVTAELSQGGSAMAVALAAVGVERNDPVELYARPAPRVVDPGEIAPLERGVAPPIPMSARYEMRHCIGFPAMTAGPEAVTGGWIRQSDGGDVDVAALIAYSDAWPPSIFSTGAFVPVPTVDLTVHVRRSPARHDTSWCLVRFETRSTADGYITEDGEIWSRDGLLLAQARQLAVMIEIDGAI